MNRGEARAIVEAVETTAGRFDHGTDHAEGVVAYAMRSLASDIAAVLGVPGCTCRYGHNEDDDYLGDEKCPRRGWAGD